MQQSYLSKHASRQAVFCPPAYGVYDNSVGMNIPNPMLHYPNVSLANRSNIDFQTMSIRYTRDLRQNDHFLGCCNESYHRFPQLCNNENDIFIHNDIGINDSYQFDFTSPPMKAGILQRK